MALTTLVMPAVLPNPAGKRFDRSTNLPLASGITHLQPDALDPGSLGRSCASVTLVDIGRCTRWPAEACTPGQSILFRRGCRQW
jgi:hypothetical protein